MNSYKIEEKRIQITFTASKSNLEFFFEKKFQKFEYLRENFKTRENVK